MKKLIVICLFLIVPVIAPALETADRQTGHGRQALLLTIDNAIINPITAEYIMQGITRAEQNSEYACVMIQLDTPGGLLESTREIVKKILNARVPVIVYVAPGGARAASAGVFITLAAHVAAMAPSTNIGAAHPVMLSGGNEKDKNSFRDIIEAVKAMKKKDNAAPTKQGKPAESGDVMTDKIVNDTVAWVVSIAHLRGRNAVWAEQSVRQSVSLPEQEAVTGNVVDLVAGSVPELLKAVNGNVIDIDHRSITLQTEGIRVHHVPMNTRQRFLDVISNPNIAYILMMLGFYGLLYEFTHPGFGFPGIAGAICLVLSFYSMHTLPTNYAGLALIIFAIVLFIAEVKIASMGLLTVGGLISLVLGSLILFDAPGDYMRVSLTIILPFTATTAAITILLVRLVVNAQKKKSITGQEGMMGEIGEAQGPIQGSGTVFIHGELWNAESDELISDKDKVKVIGVRGLTLTVKKENDE
jgi:membrane-bound serine protease (ClpP class)